MVEKEVLAEQSTLKSLKEAELRRGERPDGTLIGKYKSKSYEAFKRRINPKAKGNVDLILTGNFKNSARVQSLTQGRFNFLFSDSKTQKLLSRYGNDLKGLNQDTFNEVQANKIKPRFVEQLKKELRQ